MAAIGCRPEPGSRLAEGHPKGLALTPARTAPHWPARMRVVLMRSERARGRAGSAYPVRSRALVGVVLVDPGRDLAPGWSSSSDPLEARQFTSVECGIQ